MNEHLDLEKYGSNFETSDQSKIKGKFVETNEILVPAKELVNDQQQCLETRYIQITAKTRSLFKW